MQSRSILDIWEVQLNEDGKFSPKNALNQLTVLAEACHIEPKDHGTTIIGFVTIETAVVLPELTFCLLGFWGILRS